MEQAQERGESRLPAYHIVISKGQNTLSLYEGARLVKAYPVGTGRSPEQTPEGTFPIVLKTWYPSWTNPETGVTIPGGSPQNPLGTRWMGLGVGNTAGHSYGIHGTNQPGSVGHHISHGCVRMLNQDVEELYNLVPAGTLVQIEP